MRQKHKLTIDPNSDGPTNTQCCPECNGQAGDVEHTCIGMLGGKNTNRASCGCGWIGIVDELANLENSKSIVSKTQD